MGVMGPPKGNQNNKKFKKDEKELKQEAYRQYCAWIASGKSKESFVFQHPTMSCTSKTMERYIREEPLDFPLYKKEEANSQSLTKWEEVGYKMMTGEIPKCQPAIYQMFMRNKFGWDKESKDANNNRDQAVDEFNKLRREIKPQNAE